MEKEKLTERIEIRVSPREKNIIKMLANMYADGNISAYIVERVINTSRKFVDQQDFDLSIRKVRPKERTSR